MWYHDPTPSYHAHARPNIRCAFAAMRGCDAAFGRNTARAASCREGARDAHLLDVGIPKVHADAYHHGRVATLTSCPIVWDDLADVHHHVHRWSHHPYAPRF